MYITAAGQGILVFNSYKAVGDLVERRGHIYGDLPRLISKLYVSTAYTLHHSSYQVLGELLSGGLLSAGMRYNETCIALSFFSITDRQTFDSWLRFHRPHSTRWRRELTFTPTPHPNLSIEAVLLTDGLLKKRWQLGSGIPSVSVYHVDDLESLVTCGFHRTAASSILSILYDLPTVSSADDHTVTTINIFMEQWPIMEIQEITLSSSSRGCSTFHRHWQSGKWKQRTGSN